MKQLDKVVKGIRMDLGLSQVELAKRIGVGERFIRRIEKGDSTLPIDRIDRFLIILGRTWFDHRYQKYVETNGVVIPRRKSFISHLVNLLKRSVTNENI